MKILHICNDYSYSKVYKNLYQELDLLGHQQFIYHPIRASSNLGNNVFDFKTKGSKLVYSSFMLKKYHRVLFRLKTYSLFKDLEQNIDVSKIDISYPTTLFSDGAIAYRLYKKYNIDYVVAVRNTDINLFMKYRKDLLPLMHEILTHAKKIIFISKALQNLFFSKIKDNKEYIRKSVLISNGIDRFWLDNVSLRKASTYSFKFLFIGRFDHNKNAEYLIKSLIFLKKKYPKIQLTLVGGGGDKERLIKEMIQDIDWIHYIGYLYDKHELLEVFRKNDYFVMPSIYETFGLVYIEALSQGLPVLYTKNQGIDGLLENVGESCYPNQQSIQNAIEKILGTSHFDMEKINFESFRWSNIAGKYVEIFK